MLEQLPLKFNLLDNVNFANFFFSHNNQQLYFTLKNFLDPSNPEQFFYLIGNKKAGKTHLLQACCSKALENNIPAMYICVDNLLNIDLLDGLENLSLLCLDNINCIVANPSIEEKLFYLFNSMRAKHHKLIVAADCTPNNLTLQLPDLKSRMTWGITYYLHGLTDQEKISALIMRAEQIGLELNNSVANFLLSRVSRSTGQLFEVLEKLDHASLAAKRRLTIPFVKEVLSL